MGPLRCAHVYPRGGRCDSASTRWSDRCYRHTKKGKASGPGWSAVIYHPVADDLREEIEAAVNAALDRARQCDLAGGRDETTKHVSDEIDVLER